MVKYHKICINVKRIKIIEIIVGMATTFRDDVEAATMDL